jgi:UDP-N-acetylglucosamine:LPS N-acetylglucosamine transferase
LFTFSRTKEVVQYSFQVKMHTITILAAIASLAAAHANKTDCDVLAGGFPSIPPSTEAAPTGMKTFLTTKNAATLPGFSAQVTLEE